MTQHRHSKLRSRGFTLVECIMVIMILGIAGAGIWGLQGKLFANEASVQNLQVRTPLMLECAEEVLAVRRFKEDGYAEVSTTAFGTNLCGSIVALSGHTVPSVSFTDLYTGPGCPTDGICKLVTITESGMTPLTLMLVDY